MSLKAEIETWAAALELYDAQSFDEALAKFEDIADSSKILFNIGLIYATLGEHEVAVENFRAATNLDQYLAVAYFQCGVSNFLLGMYEEATKDFEDALLYLRGNLTIDYAQLGLKFRLYSCEVLFNKGLSLIYQGAEADGLTDMEEARKEKQTAEHGVIDEALADRGEGYTVFSIPVGVLYRPASSKVKNLASKNYLGQAKLVAATDASETFVGFTGSARAAARSASDLPTSAGPSSEPTAPGIQRRGTTAARIEGTREAASTANDLRRRPSDNTASVTHRLGRSATAASASRALPKLASMPERQESDDELSRNSQGEPYGDLLDSYSESGRARAPASDWNRSIRTASPVQVNRTASPIHFSRTTSPIQPFGINARARGPPARRPTLNGSAYDDPGYTSSGGPPVRRPTLNGSAYDDAGYGSGPDYPETVMSYAMMTKIRVKLHHDSDTRGMAVDPEMQLSDFMAKVTKKFQLEAGRVSMKYKDEEGSMVSILDEDDWESAVDTARSYAKGRPEGKVEIWVEEL